jgi:type IV pilus assembly protein PilQ
VLALVLLASAALGRSQTAPVATANAAAVAKPAEPTQATEAAGTGAVRNKDTLSVDFPDEDVRTILRNVADLFELNLVVPDALQGKTSIKLHDVTWRQIFEVVLTPVGYTYVDDAGIIKVVSMASLAEEPANTEVFVLSYARAGDVQGSIGNMIDPAKGGKLTLDQRSNSLIVTERPSRLNKIRPIIKQLDRPTEQVMIESKFLEVIESDVTNLGVNWASLSSYTLTGTGSSTINNSYSNSQTNKDNDVAFMKDGYSQLDQVVNATNNPFSPYTAKIGPAYTQDSTTKAITYTDQGPSSTRTTARNLINTATFTPDSFKMILSALKTMDHARVVSNPTIVTLNNTEASIDVGEEDPIPNYTYNQQTGSYEVSGFNYKPIGVILKVTPQVNASGFIKLNLSPEVSQTDKSLTFGNATIPIITVRKATTQVTLKDGYTMGIGGLISSKMEKSGTSVPFLGSIPILGKLFSSKSNNGSRTNLLIFITARTVSGDGASVEDIFDPRATREMDLRRDELPGYRDGSNPFIPDEGAKAKK